MWEECYVYVSPEIAAIIDENKDFQDYWSHENTGRVVIGATVYGVFAPLAGSAFTALLATPGSMALGVVCIYALGVFAGSIWNKCWAKIFSWFS